MDSTYELPAGPPRAGQHFLDAQGRHWAVHQVSPLGSCGGGAYSVLRVSVRGPDNRGATFRITSQEFMTLAAGGALKVVRA